MTHSAIASPPLLSPTLRGRPHENTLCIASFWPTGHMDPEKAASENALFWKRVSGWKDPKMQPFRSRVDSESAYFPKRWRHRPTPRPLASNLWTHLITTTYNNNNGGLLLVFMFLATYSPCSRVWVTAAVDLINDPNKRFWFLCTSHFHLLLLVFRFSFYCLFVNSAQALCACSVSYSPFLVNFKHHQ